MERPPVGDARRDIAHRDAQPLADAPQLAAHRPSIVNVLVGVEVGRRPPGEPLEALELALDLLGDRVRGPRGRELVARVPLAVAVLPLAEIEVKTDAERAA